MYAVITGDIVGSTLTVGARSQNHFSEIDSILSGTFGLMQEKGWLNEGDFVSFRGDSFQCILPAERGIDAALLLKAALKGGTTTESEKTPVNSWSCRLVIGLGEVTYRADNVSKSNGPAFQRSGRTLDTLPKDQYIAIVCPWDQANEEFDLMSSYMDIIIERLWTPISGQTALIYFRGDKEQTQKEMAEIVGISQSAMNSRIHAAELRVLEKTIMRYQSIVKSYSS